MSRRAADRLVERLRRKPDALLCLATGGTPTRTYQLLAHQGATEPALFAHARILKLDEWGGLAMDDPASCEHHLRSLLVEPLGLGSRYHGFQSQPADPQAECDRIARWLEQNGPIDVCVLGLGVNGHLGFNEPAPMLQPHAHVAQLAQTSLEHAMLALSRGRPGFGLTLGMAELLHAREVLLLVSGPAKREPMRRLLDAWIASEFPASLLSLHPAVTLLCDQAALP
jgi:putative deaminase/isomerase